MNVSRLVAAVAFAVALPGAASAQSLFGMRGMGIPVAPVDARARALGGMGIGLLGLNASLANPADVAGLTRRGIVAVLQPGSASPEVAGSTGNLEASRFPLVRLIYPFGRLVATLGYGSFLEQSWGIRQTGIERYGADSVDVTDIIESTGGLSRLALGAAWPLSERVAIGAEVGLHAGVLDRRVRRTFADTVTGLLEFDTRYRWGYRGALATLGVRWDPRSAVRLSGSVTLADRVEIDGRTTGSGDDSFRAPFRVTAGGSAYLSQLWLATAGAEWSGRGGEAETVFDASDAIAMRRNAWRLGGGLEYHGVRSGQRAFPFRVGAGYQQLPFYNTGEDPASEWSGAVGMGFRLAGDEANPLAVADFAYERGRRSGLASAALPDGLRESFWRLTFTLSLFGN